MGGMPAATIAGAAEAACATGVGTAAGGCGTSVGVEPAGLGVDVGFAARLMLAAGGIVAGDGTEPSWALGVVEG